MSIPQPVQFKGMPGSAYTRKMLANAEALKTDSEWMVR